jgi:hypothetical protein
MSESFNVRTSLKRRRPSVSGGKEAKLDDVFDFEDDTKDTAKAGKVKQPATKKRRIAKQGAAVVVEIPDEAPAEVVAAENKRNMRAPRALTAVFRTDGPMQRNPGCSSLGHLSEGLQTSLRAALLVGIEMIYECAQGLAESAVPRVVDRAAFDSVLKHVQWVRLVLQTQPAYVLNQVSSCALF